MPYSFSHLPVFTAPRRSPTISGRCRIPHRTMKFAAAARGALKHCLFGNVRPDQRRLAAGSELLQVSAHAENKFFGDEHLPGVVRGTVFRAAAAFHTTERLQRAIRVMSLPVSRPKSSSPASGGMRLNPARAGTPSPGLNTRCRCFVCGISGRKIARASVCAPPVQLPADRLLGHAQPRQVRPPSE